MWYSKEAWDGTVRFWDPLNGNQLGEPLIKQPIWVSGAAIAHLPDGTNVIITADGGQEGTLRIWEASRRRIIGECIKAHEGWIKSMCIGYLDGITLAVSGGNDGSIKMWNLKTHEQHGKTIFHYPSLSVIEPSILSVAFGKLNDKAFILSAGTDGKVCIWDIDTGKEFLDALEITRERDFPYVNAVTFGYVRNKPVIITGGNDSAIRMWDPVTNKQIGKSLTGHSAGVTSVALLPDGQKALIVSTSQDATVRIWEFDTGNQLAMFAADDPLECCAISSDQKMIFVGSKLGKIHFLSIEGISNRIPSERFNSDVIY